MILIGKYINTKQIFKSTLYFYFRLDLDKWINDPPSSSSESEEEEVESSRKNNFYLDENKKKTPELSPEEIKKV